MKNDHYFNSQYEELIEEATYLHNKGCILQYAEDDEFNGRTIEVNGREFIHFANCSYMGLETHHMIKQGIIDAARTQGSLFSSSRSVISSPLYLELEELLSRIFPGYLVIAPTTTLAHCSVLPLMIQDKDAIILDAYVHNSVRMASQLCKANGTFVIINRHNDINYLQYLVYRLKKEGYRNIWYCADGIYSMQGDKLHLSQLKSLLKKEKNLYAYIDDAHGVSWTGSNGCGYVIGNYGLQERMIVVVTLGKSFAASGAALIFPDKKWAELVRTLGQTMIFSGPISPPILGAAIASAKIHLKAEFKYMQNELKKLILYFKKRCLEKSLPLAFKDVTPIQIIKTGDAKKTIYMTEKLIEHGCFTTSALYPAVSKGNEGTRITLTRHLKKEDIDFLVEGMAISLNEEHNYNNGILPANKNDTFNTSLS
jgi:7-keto-8-aminopelargonate synthetase-like enzyme